MSTPATPQHYTIAVPFAGLVQQFILGPLYQGVQNAVFGQIANCINAPNGNGYAQAIGFTATGINYTISAINSGSDQYQNAFTVSFVNKSNGVDIVINGTVSLYKEISKNAFFCTARAYATGSVGWNGTFSILTQNGPAGTPVLSIHPTVQISKNTSNQDANSCANMFPSWRVSTYAVINAINNINQMLLTGVFSSVANGAANEFAHITQAFPVIPPPPPGTVLIPQVASIDNKGNFHLTLVGQ